MGDTVREKRVEPSLQQLEQLPTLPAVAVRVLDVTADEGSSAKEVTSLISTDIALSARILQLVHRADAGVRGEVNSVERAVVLLGFDAVRSAVLAVTVFHTLSASGGPSSNHGHGHASGHGADGKGHFSREAFWKHCVAVACCAELLAGAANRNAVASIAAGSGAPTAPPSSSAVAPSQPRPHEPLNPSEAFICGLLHDLGKVALDAVLPKSFSRVVEAADLLRGNVADVERTVIGIDHMVAGKRLAERWKLPAAIRDCIWLHGQSPDALPATVSDPLLVNLVTLADQLVREQHLGYSGNYAFAVNRQTLLDALGLTADNVDAILQRLISHIDAR